MQRAVSILVTAASFALAACTSQASEDSTTASVAETAAQVSTLTPQEVAELLESGSIRLIDVRSDAEVAEGMIPGAEHVMLDNFDPAALDATDGREVVLYCRSGRRSGIAAERLASHTGKTARHLGGGILAWQDAGQPLAQPN